MLLYIYNCLRRHNQPNLNVSNVVQTLFINKFHVKSVLKLSVKCAKLLDILKKVRFIAFRRVTCFGISPLLVLGKASLAGWKVCRSSQSSLQHCVPLYWSEKVCIHGMIKYKWLEYGVTFIYELFFQVFKNNFVVYVIECLSREERCSDRTSQHYHPLQCSQEMCIRGLMCKNCPKY